MVESENFLIVSKNETFPLERALLIAEALEHPIVVHSENRAFLLSVLLGVWEDELKLDTKSCVRSLAHCLCAVIDFRSVGSGKSSVACLTIEKELFKLLKGKR